MSSGDSVIQAAGGIIFKTTEVGEQIILVHRKRHNDWTLPKGKLKENESHQEAAIREAREETGCVAQLTEYAGAIGYEVNAIPKIVLFWRMALIKEGEITDREEVLETRWVGVSEAFNLLTHHQERELLSRLMPRQARPYESPKELKLQASSGIFPWLGDRRGLERLQREFEAFRVEVAFLKQRSRLPDDGWVHAVEDQLKNVEKHLGKDIESGWYCLHSAQRLAVFGLDEAEIADRARSLRQESDKLSSWRGKAVLEILSADNPVTAARLAEALELRDEYAANQYHKIRLMGDQLELLLWISSIALALLLIALRMLPVDASMWDYRLVATILLVGVLGAGFSAAQSLISDKGASRIPERVANRFVTIARTFFGATAALAGHVLYQSGIFTIKIGDMGLGAALAISFVFGYTGEKLISRIADSLSAGQSRDR